MSTRIYVPEQKSKYVYPCQPQFFYIKWGASGYILYACVIMYKKTQIRKPHHETSFLRFATMSGDQYLVYYLPDCIFPVVSASVLF